MGETTRYALRISTETEGDRLKVVPYIEASDAAALRYEVISRKEGPSGTASTRQAGSVQVACCAPAAASQLTLRVRREDRYVITVRLYAAGRQVAERTVIYP